MLKKESKDQDVMIRAPFVNLGSNFAPLMPLEDRACAYVRLKCEEGRAVQPGPTVPRCSKRVVNLSAPASVVACEEVATV